MTYPSRLLQTLDQQIQQCTNRDDLARLVSRRAIHLARLNHLDEAKAEIARLRAELGTALGVRAGVWILLAEGIIGYFELDVERAFDRLRRSNGIAQSAELIELLGATNAWLSHVQYQKSAYKDAFQHLNDSFSLASKDDHFSRCRAALVASDACGFANLPEQARAWQHLARLHATAEGDEASLAALLFNATIYRINEIRLSDALGEDTQDDLAAVERELDSSLTFDALSSGFAMPGSPGVLKAHIQVIRRQFSDAAKTFRAALADGLFIFNRATVEADLTYSLASMGDINSAKPFADSAVDSLTSVLDPDDCAFVHARLAQFFTITGDSESFETHRKLAIDALTKLRKVQEEIRELVRTLPDPKSISL